MKTQKEKEYKDGIYKGDLATYVIKDDKIIMIMRGRYYTTSSNFMQGAYKEPLTEEMSNQFVNVYENTDSW